MRRNNVLLRDNLSMADKEKHERMKIPIYKFEILISLNYVKSLLKNKSMKTFF